MVSLEQPAAGREMLNDSHIFGHFETTHKIEATIRLRPTEAFEQLDTVVRCSAGFILAFPFPHVHQQIPHHQLRSTL